MIFCPNERPNVGKREDGVETEGLESSKSKLKDRLSKYFPRNILISGLTILVLPTIY